MDKYKIKTAQTVDGATAYTFTDVSETIYETDSVNKMLPDYGIFCGIPDNVDDISHNYSVLSFNSNQFVSGSLSVRKFSGVSNFRLAVMYESTTADNSRKFAVRWTNIHESIQDYYKSDNTSVNLANAYTGGAKSVPTVNNYMSHWFLSFINNIKINDLIFVVRFISYTVKYDQYNSDNNMYNRQTLLSTDYLKWSDIKPADKLPAGNSYDDDLYNYGYKKISEDADSVTYQIISGVAVTPYYGKSSMLYDENTDSYYADVTAPHIYGVRQTLYNTLTPATDDYPVINGVTGHTRHNMYFIIDSYNDDLDSVVYSNLPAVCVTSSVGNYTNVNDITGTNICDSSYAYMTNTDLNPANLFYNNSGYGGIISDLVSDTDTVTVFPATSAKCDISNSFDGAYTSTFYYKIMADDGYCLATGFRPSARSYSFAHFCFYPVKKLWQLLACTGMYYTSDVTHAQNAPLGGNTGNNDNIYLGQIDDNGLATGVMLQGFDVTTSPQSQMDDISDTPYKPVSPQPENPTGGGDFDKEKGTGGYLPDYNRVRLPHNGGFTTFYYIYNSDLADLGTFLHSAPTSFWQALGTATDDSQYNILQYICSLKWYPMSVTDTTGLFPDTAVSDISIGFNNDGKIPLMSGNSYKLNTIDRLYNCGSVSVPYKYASETFLDMEPYTSVQCFLPYIGIIDLHANDVLGYTISCTYVVDLVTGMCTAFLDNGRYTIVTASGKIGVDLTVTGNDVITQSERMANSYITAGTSAVQNGIALVSSAMTENVTGVISGATNMIGSVAQNAVSIANAKRGVPTAIGSGSGFASTYSNQYPQIIVSRPAVKIPATYGHSNGYLYTFTDRIINLQGKGFTLLENPDLTGVCTANGNPLTEEELNIIYGILTSGFYA